MIFIEAELTMKDFINKKQILLCLALVAIIVAITVVLIKINPEEDVKYEDYIKSTTLLSAGDSKMTLDEGVFLTKNKQAYYEAYYLAEGYLIGWDKEYEAGKTYESLVLDESLTFVEQIFLFSEYAISQGMTLTDTEESGISSSVSEFLTDSGENVINATYANADLLTRIYTRTAYYDKVCEQIYNDTDLTVSDEEARQCLVAAVEISPLYFDSPERVATKIVERVNNGEVITEVATKYDVEAVKGNVGKGDMDGNALEQLCLGLKDGQCKMVEMDGSYFVVYCYLENDDEATAISKENIIAERKDAAITAFFEKLKEDMPITVNMEAWETINFDEAIFTEEDYNSITATSAQ